MVRPDTGQTTMDTILVLSHIKAAAKKGGIVGIKRHLELRQFLHGEILTRFHTWLLKRGCFIHQSSPLAKPSILPSTNRRL
ncbi:MAG: hypothetical protein VYA34_12450 [Myxococcota bacterium]|nr:hypothetical protein [Myxococcota bacterium]